MSEPQGLLQLLEPILGALSLYYGSRAWPLSWAQPPPSAL